MRNQGSLIYSELDVTSYEAEIAVGKPQLLISLHTARVNLGCRRRRGWTTVLHAVANAVSIGRSGRRKPKDPDATITLYM